MCIAQVLLGTGGGGDAYTCRIMVERLIENGVTLRVLDVGEVVSDDLVIPVGKVGSPTVSQEKLPSAEAGLAVVRKTAAFRGQAAGAIIASEIGGSNGFFAMFVAATAGLPVVDGDGMGRAFPECQMVTFDLAGISPSPTVVADEYGNTAIVDAKRPHDVERLVRAIVTGMGGSAAVADYSMRGSELPGATVGGTISLALNIGKTVRQAFRNRADPFDALSQYLTDVEKRETARVLFSGKIADVSRETRGGFVYGQIKVTSRGNPNRVLTITLKNEYLVAYEKNDVVAIVPDLICVLDSQTARAISTEHNGLFGFSFDWSEKE